MKGGRGLAIAAVVGLGLWAWSKGKKGAVAAPALTSTKAPATVAETEQMTSQVASQLSAIAAQHPEDPTLADHMSQAIASAQQTLELGVSLKEDPGAQIVDQQVNAYQQYKAAGGTLDFETLTLYRDWREWEAIVATEKEAGRSLTWEEAKAVTETAKATTIPTPTEPTITEPAPPPPPPPPPIPPIAEAEVIALIGSQPTASIQELNIVEQTYGRESEAYQAVIDTAFEAAQSQAQATGGVVSWSSEGGYQAISLEEAAGPEYWDYY